MVSRRYKTDCFWLNRRRRRRKFMGVLGIRYRFTPLVFPLFGKGGGGKTVTNSSDGSWMHRDHWTLKPFISVPSSEKHVITREGGGKTTRGGVKDELSRVIGLPWVKVIAGRVTLVAFYWVFNYTSGYRFLSLRIVQYRELSNLRKSVISN